MTATTAGAETRPPSCGYAWASDRGRVCDQPAVCALYIKSALTTVRVDCCEHHSVLLQRRYGGINPARVVKVEWTNTTPQIISLDQGVLHG